MQVYHGRDLVSWPRFGTTMYRQPSLANYEALPRPVYVGGAPADLAKLAPLSIQGHAPFVPQYRLQPLKLVFLGESARWCLETTTIGRTARCSDALSRLSRPWSATMPTTMCKKNICKYKGTSQIINLCVPAMHFQVYVMRCLPILDTQSFLWGPSTICICLVCFPYGNSKRTLRIIKYFFPARLVLEAFGTPHNSHFLKRSLYTSIIIYIY